MLGRWESPGELSVLDSDSIGDDGCGGYIFTVTVFESSRRWTERLPVDGKPGLYADGRKMTDTLARPLVLRLRLDLAAVHELARRAARAKSGRAKSGPVTLTGGKAARWERKEGWT